MIDKDSQTWRAVKKGCDEMIAVARTDIETPGLDIMATERLRGAIAALNQIRNMAEPDDEPAPGPAPY